MAPLSMITDSGLETDLLFNHGVDLVDFAAFPLVDDGPGRALLESYYREHLAVADAAGLAIVLETPTWRASADWGARLGYDADDLARVNRAAVALVAGLRAESRSPVLVSGCVGPRGDGYLADTSMTAEQALAYHLPQVRALASADLVSALTLTTAAEAVGFVRAAQDVGAKAVVSFTVEVDGRLPDGALLTDAVRSVDDQTDGAPAWFMVNCAHPRHLVVALDGGQWPERVRAVRVNASSTSHAELDASPVLDAGDPEDLAAELAGLCSRVPAIDVLGGCCGTDVRHVRAIVRACGGS